MKRLGDYKKMQNKMIDKTKKFGLYAIIDFHIYKTGELIKSKETSDPENLFDHIYNFLNCEVREITK